MTRALDIATREGKSTFVLDLHEQLCTNLTFANEADFAATEFIKAPYHEESHALDFESISEFDYSACLKGLESNMTA